MSDRSFARDAELELLRLLQVRIGGVGFRDQCFHSQVVLGPRILDPSVRPDDSALQGVGKHRQAADPDLEHDDH